MRKSTVSTDRNSTLELQTVECATGTKPLASGNESRTIRTFFVNAGHGGLRGAIFVLNTVLLVPILLKGLGKEQFAILAFAAPFLRYGFNGVFDFGIANGIVRYTSRSFASKDAIAVNEYLSSGLVLYLVWGVAIIGLYYLVGPALLLMVIRGNMAIYVPAREVLEHVVWIYALFSLSNPFYALLMGIQRVEATHWVGSCSLVVEICGVLLLRRTGLNLSNVVHVYATNAVIGVVLCVVLAAHYFPSMKFSLGRVRMAKIREMLSYGIRFSTTTLATILNPILDKLILARYAGLGEVALYEVAARLVELLRRASQLLLLPVLPMAGAREHVHDAAEKSHFYRRIFAGNLILSSGLYAIPISLVFTMLPLWLGPGSELTAKIFIVLALTVFCQSLVGPLVLTFAGTGRLTPLVLTSLIGLCLNVSLTPLLAHHWKLEGLLAGTAVAYGGVSLAFLIWSTNKSEFKMSLQRLLKSTMVSVLAGLAPGFFLSWLLHLERRPVGWLQLLLVGVFAGAAFLVLSLTQGEYRQIIAAVCREIRVRLSVEPLRLRLDA